MSKSLPLWLVFVGFLALALCVTGQTQAALIAEDPFLSGDTPALGQYAPGDLVPQNPAVSTFNAPWADGLTTSVAGTFDAVPVGLTWAGFGATDGAVQYQYSSSLANVQAAVRPFTNPVTDVNRTYYIAGLMSFDANFSTATTSLALTGLLNAEEGDPAVSYPLGVQWGFQGNGTGGVKAVLRARASSTGNPTITDAVAANVSPGTHLFVVKVEQDYQQLSGGTSSTDRVSVWLDPVVGGPEFQVAPTFVKDYANWLDPSEDMTRIVKNVVFRVTDVGANTPVGYDEVRAGNRWAEVMPLTNPDVVFLRQGFDEYQHLAAGIRSSTTSANTNYGASDEMIAGSEGALGSGHYRSLLAFGTSEVPDGATITDVELVLTVKSISTITGTGPIELRLTDPSVDMVETEVTWNKINAATSWTTGGGDPESAVLGSINQPTAALQVVTFHATAGLLDAVQDAVDGDELLELAVMAPQAEALQLAERNFVKFYTDDATTASYRPLLKITYAPVPRAERLALLLGAAAMLLAGQRRTERN